FIQHMKDLSLARIKEIFPQFGRSPITENDFWRAAKREKIRVRRIPMPVRGCYFINDDGHHYIYLNDRLSGPDFVYTALHELCHYLFDIPAQTNVARCSGRSGERNDPREHFADAFAIAAMMPIETLFYYTHDEVEADVWLAQMICKRIVIYTEYGF